MHAAVIAAGRGERLRQAGWLLPKPLVPVAGRPLWEYVLRCLAGAGATKVTVVLNTTGSAVEAYSRRYWPNLEFEFVYRDTPSSMESLFALADKIDSERFLLSTADLLTTPETVADFVAAARGDASASAVLAVTSLVDDEKPLWVRFEGNRQIVALGESAGQSGWVTAGLYHLDRRIFDYVSRARAARLTSLRSFFALLLDSGLELRALPVGPCVDVDRPEDVRSATEFVERQYRIDA